MPEESTKLQTVEVPKIGSEFSAQMTLLAGHQYSHIRVIFERAPVLSLSNGMSFSLFFLPCEHDALDEMAEMSELVEPALLRYLFFKVSSDFRALGVEATPFGVRNPRGRVQVGRQVAASTLPHEEREMRMSKFAL